jgi:hypothetical protein
VKYLRQLDVYSGTMRNGTDQNGGPRVSGMSEQGGGAMPCSCADPGAQAGGALRAALPPPLLRRGLDGR